MNTNLVHDLDLAEALLKHGTSLERKTISATATTTTDQGVFKAIAATHDLDRQGEQIARGAFKATIQRWQASAKTVPLHWDHQTSPEDLIGYVDPNEMHETKQGLIVGGKVDLETERGAQAWRAMKSGSMGLSFGYLSDSHEEGGVRVIDTIDLFEVSVTPHPVNDQTKILSLKGMQDRPLQVARFKC